MNNYMPNCVTCEHFESCIIQKHLTEMALILWNINREEEKTEGRAGPQGEAADAGCAGTWRRN